MAALDDPRTTPADGHRVATAGDVPPGGATTTKPPPPPTETGFVGIDPSLLGGGGRPAEPPEGRPRPPAPPPAPRARRRSPLRPQQRQADRESSVKARSAWRAQVRARAAELRLELGYADPRRSDGLTAGISDLLARADLIARTPGGVRAWWTGAQVEMAWRALHVAEHNLYAIQTSAAVAGRIPEIAASAHAYLQPKDEVASSFTSWRETWKKRAAKEELSDADRHLLRSVVDAAHRASSTQIAKVRSFRNVLVIAALLLVAVLLAIAAAAWVRPELIPLCGEGPQGLECPPAEGMDPTPWGVAQVLLFGAFGGAVAGVFSISHQRGTRVPYQVPVVQALLKVPAGAATALLGVVLLQSNLTSGITAPSSAAVAGYAALFGYAQQLLTTFVDRRAGEVLAPAQPRSDDATDDSS